MKAAFKNVNKVFEAAPVPDKPGFVTGWLKMAPQIVTKDGVLVCTAEFRYGEWSTFYYEVVTDTEQAGSKLGYRIGLVVGTIIQLPRYIFWICAIPFLWIRGRIAGKRFGKRLFRFYSDTARQRQENN